MTDQSLFDFRAPPPSRFPCESSGVLVMAGLERILGGALGLWIGSDTKAQMSYGVCGQHWLYLFILLGFYRVFLCCAKFTASYVATKACLEQQPIWPKAWVEAMGTVF